MIMIMIMIRITRPRRYHTHAGAARGEGGYGFLIVAEPPDAPPAAPYDDEARLSCSLAASPAGRGGRRLDRADSTAFRPFPLAALPPLSQCLGCLAGGEALRPAHRPPHRPPRPVAAAAAPRRQPRSPRARWWWGWWGGRLSGARALTAASRMSEPMPCTMDMAAACSRRAVRASVLRHRRIGDRLPRPLL